ncbi:unnamed protein product [Rangifer tarandus platyrhynchus]|uniref:Uncharacterized protein n=1 Tax=Rangifer tarandus platyrhynchus TaxID=3082113 RepID=A0AC59Y4X1_RANTA
MNKARAVRAWGEVPLWERLGEGAPSRYACGSRSLRGWDGIRGSPGDLGKRGAAGECVGTRGALCRAGSAALPGAACSCPPEPLPAPPPEGALALRPTTAARRPPPRGERGSLSQDFPEGDWATLAGSRPPAPLTSPLPPTEGLRALRQDSGVPWGHPSCRPGLGRLDGTGKGCGVGLGGSAVRKGPLENILLRLLGKEMGRGCGREHPLSPATCLGPPVYQCPWRGCLELAFLSKVDFPHLLMASDARESSTAKAWVLAVRGKRETVWSGPYRTFGGGALCVCLRGGSGLVWWGSIHADLCCG